jgi:hypothetical protein
MRVSVPTDCAGSDNLIEQVEEVMDSKTIIVPLFAAAVLATGCASSDARYGGNDNRFASVRSNPSYYAVIDSIESHADGNDGHAAGNSGAHVIRVRFDDRTYQTVTQAHLDGLRVGDSVRIEGDRVRRY